MTTLAKIDPAKVVWEVEDRFSSAKAVRIFTPDGDPTDFAMVYASEDGENFNAVRPVSDRYQPVGTGQMVEAVYERLGFTPEEKDIHVKTDKHGAMVKVEIMLSPKTMEIRNNVFDAGTDLTQHGENVKTDTMRPSLMICNAYDATRKASFAFGFSRLVCKNGLYIWEGGLSTTAIHTVHEVAGLFDKINKADVKDFASRVKALSSRKVDEKTIDAVGRMIPKKYATEMKETSDGTAYSLMTYLTYLQSHVYTVARSGQLDKPIRHVLNLAA